MVNILQVSMIYYYDPNAIRKSVRHIKTIFNLFIITCKIPKFILYASA